MIELLTTLVLALHLMCVNVSSAGPIIAIWLEFKEGRGDRVAGQSGRYLLKMALILLIAGGLLGLVMGLLLWNDEYSDAVLAVGSRIAAGIGEYVFSAVLIGIHLLWWKKKPDAGTGVRVVRGLLAFLAGTNLLYHFPFLFLVMSGVANGTIEVGDDGKIGPFLEVIAEGSILARALHFVIASFAVAGLMLACYSLRMAREGASEDDQVKVQKWGGQWALIPTLAQLPIGLWMITQLSRPAQQQLMGKDLIGTILLIVSVLGAFGLMHLLAMVARGKAGKKGLMQAMTAMFVIILLMSGVSRRITTLPASVPQEEALEEQDDEATNAADSAATSDE